MKKAFTLLLLIICISNLTGCSSEKGESYFNGTILEVNDDMFLVEVTENFNSGISVESQVYVSNDVVSADGHLELAEGDNIRVLFNGEIMETYPLNIEDVFAIYKLDDNGNVIVD